MKISDLMESRPDFTTFYHGSASEFMEFDPAKAADGNVQYGAGIYFTENRDQAIGYAEGGWLYEAEIHFDNEIDPTPGTRMDVDKIERLIKGAPDWEEMVLNWGSLEETIQSMLEYPKSEQDTADQIWFDLYRHNVDLWMRNVVALGYDGFFVKTEPDIWNNSEGYWYAVVYNPESIRNLKVTKL